MKRISVLLVLVLTLFSLAALTSCGCQASSDANQNGQTSTPGSTDNGTTNSGTSSGTANSGTTNNGGTSNGTTGNGSASNGTTGNGSMADDMIDGGESIIDGVIEGGQDVVDGVGDAITGNTNQGTGSNSSNLPTYEDMVRNGRIR